MSESTIPLQGQYPDMFSGLQSYQNALQTQANVAKTQAETATEQERPDLVRQQAAHEQSLVPLTQAQTVKEQIANQLQQLIIGSRINAANALTGGATTSAAARAEGSSYTPAGQTGLQMLTPGGGGGGTGPSGVPPASGTGTGAAVTQQPLPAAAPVTTAAPAGQGADNVLARLRSAQAGPGTGETGVEAPPAPNALTPYQTASNAPVGPPAAPAVSPAATPVAAPAAAPSAAPQTAAQQAWASSPGPNGVVLPGVGPISKAAMLGIQNQIYQGGDQAAIVEKAQASRNMRLYQLAAGANSPEEWDANARTAYEEGLITNGSLAAELGHYDRKDAIIRQFAPAEANVHQATQLAERGLRQSSTGPVVDPGAASVLEPIKVQVAETDPATGRPTGRFTEASIPRGAYAQWSQQQQAGGAGAQPQGGMTTIRHQIQGSDGNTYTVEQQVPATLINQGGAGGGGAAGGEAGAPAPSSPSYAAYLKQTRQDEGTAGGSQPNKAGSGADGLYQWMPRTWLDNVRKYNPAAAAGKSDQQLLAMRGNADVEAPVMAGFTRDNAAALGAEGVPVNAATLRLAHWFGPAGVKAMFGADANTPIEQVASSAVVEQNGLGGKTVGQVAAMVKGKYGLGPVDLGGGAAAAPGGAVRVAGPGGPTGEPPPPAAPTAATPSLPPGTITGAPSLGPLQQRQADLDVKQIEGDAKYVGDLQDAQKASEVAQTQIINTRNVAEGLPTGKWAGVTKEIASAFESLPGVPGGWGDRFLKAATGIDATKAGAWQELSKLTLQMAGQAENQIAGSRGGYNLVSLFQKSFPGLETQPDAMREMLNLFLVQHQFNVDHGQAAADYYGNAVTQNKADPQLHPYSTVAQAVDKPFLSQSGTHAPAVYVASAALLNNHPPAEAFKLLKTNAQKQAAVEAAMRADPSWVYDPNAKVAK